MAGNVISWQHTQATMWPIILCWESGSCPHESLLTQTEVQTYLWSRICTTKLSIRLIEKKKKHTVQKRTSPWKCAIEVYLNIWTQCQVQNCKGPLLHIYNVGMPSVARAFHLAYLKERCVCVCTGPHTAIKHAREAFFHCLEVAC